MPSMKNQLDGYVEDVLLPRVQELVDAALEGADSNKLRRLFNRNIGNGINFFFDRWTPVYEEQHGEEETNRVTEIIKQLLKEVKTSSQENLPANIVKSVWYLLSLSLEDMQGVPVFADQLTFTHLEVAIKNATWRIS